MMEMNFSCLSHKKSQDVYCIRNGKENCGKGAANEQKKAKL